MKNNRGFTLIEIIVSLAILGIISISFLGAMNSHLKLLNHTKKITKEVFLVQREMEEEIDLVKQEIIDIKNGQVVTNPRTLTKKTIFNSDLGGIEVSYYEVKKSSNNRSYFTLVSNIKSEPLELVKLESIGVKLKQKNDKVEYGYRTSDFNIIGNFKNLEIYKYDHLLNQVEWYVSSKEYNMPMPKDPNFNISDNLAYNSYYFPLFPRDYELIDNETVFKFGASENTFEKLSEFAGRHILYTVTPAAKSGKLGIQSVGKPIFISGLPVIDNIIMHFDASYIDVLESNEVQKVSNDWLINKWIDISSIIGQTNPNQHASYGTHDRPILKRTDMGIGFIGQYVRFSDNQFLEINQNTREETISLISVVKNRSKTEETQYMENGDVILKIGPNIEESDQKWSVELDVISSKSDNFIIGGRNVDIAEIIAYLGTLDETTKDIIEEYIYNKYKSPIVTGDIVELKNMFIEIQIGDNFELPNMVYAEMERGTHKYVSVSWLGDYNLNEEGEYKITGSALANPTKKMVYTIKVVSN